MKSRHIPILTKTEYIAVLCARADDREHEILEELHKANKELVIARSKLRVELDRSRPSEELIELAQIELGFAEETCARLSEQIQSQREKTCYLSAKLRDARLETVIEYKTFHEI